MLFEEIVFLVDTVLHEGYKQYLAKRKSGFMHEEKRMCRRAYEMYLCIENIHNNMKLALIHYFPIDHEVNCAGTFNFKTPKDKWIYFTNKDFSCLNKSVSKFVEKAYYNYDNFSFDSDLESFFTCKSGWAAKFAKKYRSGVLDGEKLEVRYLPLARPIDKMSKNGYDTCSFVKDPIIKTYDCSTLQKRLEIKEFAQINIERIADIQTNLKNFILKHCSMKDLL